MYLRPGNLPKDFFVEPREVTTTARGRETATYNTDHAEHVLGVLAQATPEEKERWAHNDHPITHIITQKGRPKAKAEDRLVHGARFFYIKGVDEIGELGIATLYYAEERSDLDANSD